MFFEISVITIGIIIICLLFSIYSLMEKKLRGLSHLIDKTYQAELRSLGNNIHEIKINTRDIAAMPLT